MPAVGALIPLIVGAVSAGTSLFSAIKGSGGPSASDLQKQQEQQAQADATRVAQQEASQRDQLMRRVAPNAQEQTGGSLTDAPLAQLIASLAGQPGNVQDAMKITNPGGLSNSNFDFNLGDLAGSLSGGQVSA